jgi:hypothetical protein
MFAELKVMNFFAVFSSEFGCHWFMFTRDQAIEFGYNWLALNSSH